MRQPKPFLNWISLFFYRWLKISSDFFVSFQTAVVMAGNRHLNQMKYKYKSGSVVLFNKNKSIFTKLITAFNYANYGESKCTHAGIIARIERIKVLIFEPVNLKEGFCGYWYKRKYFNEQIKKGKIVIGIPNRYVKNVFKHAMKYRDTKYGILDILAIAFFWLTRLKINPTGAKKLICSEAVVRILYDSSNKAINFEKEYNKPYDLITPCDIYYSKQIKIQR